MNFLNYIDGFLDKVFGIIEPYFFVVIMIFLKLLLIVLVLLLALGLCCLVCCIFEYIGEKIYKAYKKYKNEKMKKYPIIKEDSVSITVKPDVYLTMTMTRDDLLDLISRSCYGNDTVEILTDPDGTIRGLIINGKLYNDLERFNKHTGIDLTHIKVKIEKSNLEKWMEVEG